MFNTVRKIFYFNVTKNMKFSKIIHWIEINVLRTINLPIFRESNVPDIEFEKYLLQRY